MIIPSMGPPGEAGPRRTWRRAAPFVVCLVLLAAVVAALGFWRYAATYAPLRAGNFFSPYGNGNDQNLVVRATDLGTELYLNGPSGTQASVLTALANDGSHDVEIQRFERDPLIAEAEWRS